MLRLRIDPLLRDDIHQSELGYRLYAELIGSHIVEYLSRIDAAGRNVPLYWANQSIVTGITSSKVTSNSIIASVAVTGFVNGNTILNLPRWCRPDRFLTISGIYSDTGGVFKACRVAYNDGIVNVDGLTTTSSTITFTMTW